MTTVPAFGPSPVSHIASPNIGIRLCGGFRADHRQKPRAPAGTSIVVMKKISCLPAVFITGGFLWIFIWFCSSFWPAAEAVVKLPMGNAVARSQSWVGFLEPQPFVLRVDTPHGSTSAKLWADWGPANDLALYRTPEDWLIGIGGGGESVIIDVMSKFGPRIVLEDEQRKTDNKEWEFLGYLYSQGGRLHTPTEREECIALLGAGSSPYRKEHQVPHSCRSSN